MSESINVFLKNPPKSSIKCNGCRWKCWDWTLYLEQLKEVFDSCDSFDKGYPNPDELLKLCYKLQLKEQV